MALRKDEKLVQEKLIKYLSEKYSVRSWEGEDPPDIYIEYDNNIIAVEITRLLPVSFDQNGCAQNRSTQDSFGLNLCNELDSKFRKLIPPEIGIILVLHVPVSDPRKYKKQLEDYLKKFIEKGPKAGERKSDNILGKKINIAVYPQRDHSKKKIAGIIFNDDSDPRMTIDSYCEIILSDRIRDKANKCKKIRHKGPIWLALYNGYMFADKDTYARAIKNINVQHYFEKIFIVFDSGEVHQIY